MRIFTYYADCDLPEKAKANQAGFDWRGAVGLLTKSAAKFGYQVSVVTDEKTDIDSALRVGDAREQGLMHWLLYAQSETIAHSGEPALMVSPDTLIAGRLEWMLGDWDVALLTRAKPKPIVNSVIAFRPSPSLLGLWRSIEARAKELSAESQEWGADIDAVVDVLGIRPDEDVVRRVGDVHVRLLNTRGRFVSAKRNGPVAHLQAPLWDFKGPRKSLMPAFSRILGC